MACSSTDASQINYAVFVCVLLLSKLNGIGATIMPDQASSYSEASSTSSPGPEIKYDVFVSFRGTDTRRVLLGHLIKALYQKQIVAFVDNELERGEEISRELLVAIERSSISLVIFSEGYAFSRWCLQELVKIMECRKKYGQIVIPIFYGVDPAEVRHQKGTFADAFAKQEVRYGNITVESWRSAFNESAAISGIHSSKYGDDAELIEDIVQWVITRMKHMRQVPSKGLLGIGKQIAKVESLLRQEPDNVSVIGIWGMGGMGKTTIAEEVFNRMRSEYNGSVFLANVREESKRHGLIYLKNKLFSALLDEDLKISTPHELPYHVKRRLVRIKVLVVLDDVNESEQLEILVGGQEWFGTGSRIIVTTRDKKVLAKDAVVYSVEALDFDEALQLFNLNAFKQNHLEMEYHELSKRVVNYAKGNPLVLKVLGQLFQIEDKKKWESRLEKLGKMADKKILDIMRLSYDDLDRQQKIILLDIACFFDGMNLKMNYLKILLKEGDYQVDAGLERLKDIALITISDETIVRMHDIVQEMAWEIVHQESIEGPGSHSRLWDPDDIYQVLKNNEGTEAIRSITFNFSGTTLKDIQFSPQVFSKLSKLRFLDFYGGNQFLLRFPQGLQSLPNGLRYLGWMHYPLKSLPEKFSAENLIILDLPYSQMEKLWHGVQNLMSLKVLKLPFSSQLKELPDLSKATNLEVMDLKHCPGLTRVHPSVFSLNKLETLDLSWCNALTSLQSATHLTSLRYLTLYGCKRLKKFSVTSENMIELDLRHTSIQSLPSSIGHLSKLEQLHLANSEIKSMPTSIKHLKRLKYLGISDCKNLQTLPELPLSIETIDADNCTSLKKVLFPSTVAEQLKENKKKVVFWNCLMLEGNFLNAIEFNVHINIGNFAYQYLSALERVNVEDSDEDHDAEASYVYPGSTVPGWLDYRTTTDYLTIDLSSTPYAPVLGFILCFIVPNIPSEGFRLIFTISDDEVQGSNVKLYMGRSRSEISSDHVCLMYDQRCTRFLNGRAKSRRRFRIKVSAVSLSMTSEYVPVPLKGFGVHVVNPLEYHRIFRRQMELLDYYTLNLRIPIPFNDWNSVIEGMTQLGMTLVINLSSGLLLCIFLFQFPISRVIRGEAEQRGSEWLSSLWEIYFRDPAGQYDDCHHVVKKVKID